MTSRRDFLKSTVAVVAAAMVPLTVPEPVKAEAVPDTIYDLSKWQEPERYPTGIPDLDKALNGGLQPGTLTTFIGGLGCGKLNLANRIAKQYPNMGRHELNRNNGDYVIDFGFFLCSRNGITAETEKHVDDLLGGLADSRRLANHREIERLSYYGERLDVLRELWAVAQKSQGIVILTKEASKWREEPVSFDRILYAPLAFRVESDVVIEVKDLGYKDGFSYKQHELNILKNRNGQREVVMFNRDLTSIQQNNLVRMSTGLRNLVV